MVVATKDKGDYFLNSLFHCLFTTSLMDFFSQSQLNHLCGKRKIIWRLEISGGGIKKIRRCTGFAVSSDGLIMCCAHIFDNMHMERVTIHARRLEDESFKTARVVHIHSSWDLVMLKIDRLDNCEFGEFALNGTLVANQPLCYMGNPFQFVGACFFGRVSFPCINNVNLPTTADETMCMNYHLPECHEIEPKYRILGHIWDSNFFRYKTKTNFLRKLNPLVPIIECNGFTCERGFACGEMFGTVNFDGQEGFSGGPIFDGSGNVVGMMLANDAVRIKVGLFNGLPEFLFDAAAVHGWLIEGLGNFNFSSCFSDLSSALGYCSRLPAM
ncbi:hypothetical protein POM88_038488 [Heracleum sosnowskyi]|uniref:Trypsin-like serine protease n=1 Tax=Heracleum sosnowskyi TaxID=360622 RepID=A0AAD8M7Z2_9APIA|nr:hypothetical protein POM88_038488 [Heracleum sosnowskyi]